MAEVRPSEELDYEPSLAGALRPGMRLGRYELLVPIARGGMARVWAARQHGQRGFQKLVALKTILPHLAQQSEFERMFLDEARIASGVHHPNVCEIYELGEDAGQLFLAMEWVSGDSFARLLRVGSKVEAIDPRVAARIIADACAGAHAAHELVDEATGRPLGVVHRDLSPHNVLLTADGVAKVADFGVAKALGQLHDATSAGQLKGKISFMAPEQVTAGPVDRRSDVFSLGVVLYEAITGIRPFRGEGDHQIMHALLKGEFPAPSTLRRTVPPDLEKIVTRALSPEPIRRYPTAERMRFALEEFLAKGQIVTHSQVAQVVRARMGEVIEQRRDRIRRAGAAAADPGAWSEPALAGSMTPSNQGAGEHHSGVKQARPLVSTMAMDRPALPGAASEAAPPSFGVSTPPMQPQPQLARTAKLGEMAPPIPPPPDTAPVLEPSLGRVPLRALPGGAASELSGSFAMPIRAHGDDTRWGPVAAPPPTFHPASSIVPLDGGALSAEPKPAGAGSYAVAVGVGLLLALALGGVGFAFVRARAKPVTLEASGGPALVASSSATASASAPGSGPASASAFASATPPAASPTIVFELTPSDAVLSVDGKDLANGARDVPRPEAGKTVTVVARARGHEDVTILVDAQTTSPMDIALKAAADPERPASDPATKRKPKGDPALPANPY